MSDDPTPPAQNPEHETSAPAGEESESTSGSGGSNRKILLIAGGIGCLVVLAICVATVFVGYFMYDSAEESVSESADATVAIVEQPTRQPTETPEATPEPSPTITPEPTPSPEPSPTEEPTATPEPTATQEPEPEPEPTPEPEPESDQPGIAFGDDTQVVNEDILPGIYFANSPGDCYWERLSGFSGEPDDVIANGFSPNRQVVAIQESDEGFSSSGCGGWQRDDYPIREDPSADLQDGIWVVGEEVAPGTWRSEGGEDSCYWARLSGFSGESDDIITNSFGGVGDVVEIPEQDVGFESSDCAPWVRVGD